MNAQQRRYKARAAKRLEFYCKLSDQLGKPVKRRKSTQDFWVFDWVTYDTKADALYVASLGKPEPK